VSEVDSIERSEYGSTHVSATFVGRAIETASRSAGSYHRIPRGLWHQDLYVYTRDGSAGSARPGVGILGPQGVLEAHGGRLVVWFLDTDRAHQVERVELLSRGQVVAASDSPAGALAFAGDLRFLPNAWKAPLYVVFTDVPKDVFGEDVVVRAHSSSGASRTLPVWSPPPLH
jgi:hypothetical protein